MKLAQQSHVLAVLTGLGLTAILIGGCGSEAIAEGDVPGVDVDGIALRSISQDINGWTITSSIQENPDGTLTGTASFDDNGVGGKRSGGVCLVADLGFGKCDTAQDCVDKAISEGYPDNTQPGWFHYCAVAGDNWHGGHKRCWARPGTQGEYCNLVPFNNVPGTTLSVTHAPTGVPTIPNKQRYWTALSCLAGGTAPDGSPVGNPTACGTQAAGAYVYAIDEPEKVKKLD